MYGANIFGLFWVDKWLEKKVLVGLRMVKSWSGLKLLYRFTFEVLVANMERAAMHLKEVVGKDVFFRQQGCFVKGLRFAE